VRVVLDPLPAGVSLVTGRTATVEIVGSQPSFGWPGWLTSRKETSVSAVRQ
jgi:hypothetical protein